MKMKMEKNIEESVEKQAITKAKKTLSEDLITLLLHFGFFANIAMNLEREFTDKDVPIAAVNILRGKPYLYINPYTYPGLKKKERIGVLIHEIMHITLFHIMRFKQLPKGKKFDYIWNLATDCAVNQLIPRNNHVDLPDGIIIPEMLEKMYGIKNIPPKRSAEEYYEILIKNKDKIPVEPIGIFAREEKNERNEESEAGVPGAGAPEDWDWHVKWKETDGSDKINEAVIKKLVKDAYLKAKGDVPGDLERIIKEIINDKIPWEQVLSRYTAKYLRDKYVPTFKKQSRRLPDLIKGRRKKRKLSVVVAIDTSGSISDEDLAKFSGTLYKIWKTGVKVTVMEVDAVITDVYEFTGKLKMSFKGGGGTSFRPPFEKIEKERMEVDVLIYLTDGYGDAPEKKPKFPTIWVITKNGTTPSTPNGGKVTWGDIVKIE